MALGALFGAIRRVLGGFWPPRGPVRSPSQATPAPSRSRPPVPSARAAFGAGGAPTPPPRATPRGAASKSFPSRSPLALIGLHTKPARRAPALPRDGKILGPKGGSRRMPAHVGRQRRSYLRVARLSSAPTTHRCGGSGTGTVTPHRPGGKTAGRVRRGARRARLRRGALRARRDGAGNQQPPNALPLGRPGDGPRAF